MSVAFKIRDAANNIDDYFKNYGMELYQLNKKSLFLWHEIYLAVEKRLHNEFSQASMRDNGVTKIKSSNPTENLKNDIDKFDAVIRDHLYEIIVYDPSLLDEWNGVKSALEEWHKTRTT